MTVFRLPDLGEGLRQAEIVAWHVGEGDHVVADQPLVAVETEKAVVEVPSPRAGRIARLFGKPGEQVAVGAPLVEYEEGPHADTGTVVGELGARAPSPAGNVRPQSAPGGVKAAPAVRALARDQGIDIAELRPSGPEGTVTREDVVRAAASRTAKTREPLRSLRRTMAENMQRAHEAVVPATLFDEADIEAWWSPDADMTLRLIRGIAAGIAASPAINACYDDKAMERQLSNTIDLGIAVDTESGLVVPVLRDIAGQDAAALRRDIDRLKAAVRDRSVTLEDLRGATITLSNFGTLGGRHATLVVLPPQVAILGAGRIFLRVAPKGEAAAFRHMLPLSLTFDHRVVTGGEAARFLGAMIADLAKPG